jgi:alkanesulfonate monooxygenase SsuD/methylene tetrahydromethanopterin reductase-like flavin-dependent oxidoreductase (luciferase family)
MKEIMKFGIFDYIDDRGEPLHKTYDDRLALLQAAEAAGFYGYHLTEHHATPLSMTPSPGVFLAAAARETQRIRLSTLLYLLPLYHPLRLFEELCMLDHLSHGRLDVGLGRGISPMEFEAYGWTLASRAGISITFSISSPRASPATASTIKAIGSTFTTCPWS